MKIISMKRGFTADHSSTSYEFAVVDKLLTNTQKADIMKLSSRAKITARKANFHYDGEFADLPVDYIELMEKYYDIMYSESYDFWRFSVAFTLKTENKNEIYGYEFDGESGWVGVRQNSGRTIVSMGAYLDMGELFDMGFHVGSRKERYGSDEEENIRKLQDPLLALLAQIRRQLRIGDYRALYQLYLKYGSEDEVDYPVPEPIETDDDVIERFRNILYNP